MKIGKVTMLRLNNEQVGSGIWFIVGVIIVLASLRYGLGSLGSPDTGFMPLLAGSAICFFSFIGLVHGTLQLKQGASWKPAMKGLNWQKSLIVSSALIVYALLMERLGFVLCTVLFLGFLFRAVKPMSWLFTIAYSIFITLAAYVIFQIWLQAQLPKSPWGI